MHPASAWNGDPAKSNDWTTSGNWDNGLTGSGISSHIPSGLTNYLTLTTSATIENLRMGSGVTLLGGETLTIEGTATIQKNMVGYTGTNDGGNILSAPVNGMAISGSNWEPVSGEEGLYIYDVTENLWRNYLDGSNATAWFDYFEVGQGYLTSYHANNDGIKNFIGTLNSGDSYTFNLVCGTYKWNVVGNPYPSKLIESPQTMHHP